MTAKFITDKQQNTPFAMTYSDTQPISKHQTTAHQTHTLTLLILLYTQTKVIGKHRLNHDTNTQHITKIDLAWFKISVMTAPVLFVQNQLVPLVTHR